MPAHWIAALFKKLQARYGHKWVSAIDGIEEAAVNEWCEQLAGIAGVQIAHGLHEWSEDWPPSSTEFRKCCLGHDDKPKRQTSTYIALPHAERLEENKEMVDSERKKLKKKLGIKG